MKYATYERYKPSRIEWLGAVPEHWEIWKIAHGFQMTGSGTTPPPDNPDWYDGDVCWVTTSELRETVITDTEKKISQEALKNFSALKVFPEGALAIAMYGATIGRLGIFGIAAATNQACGVLFGQKAFDTKFVFYWLQAFREQIILLASGGGQPNISQEKVRSVRIACPSIEEQQTIASFLDAKTAQIDALVAQKRQLIAKLKEKRSALIARTVTRGLPPEAAEAAGLEPHPEMKPLFSSWVDECPSHWQTWKVAHGFGITGSGTTPPSDNEDWYEGDIPWVTTSELRESIITDTSKKVSRAAIKEFSALKIFPVGSLAIAMYGATIGRLGIFGVPATTNQACCVLANELAFERDFVFYWLQAFRDQIVMLATGGGQPNISQEKIRSLRIPCPSVLEQRLIVSYLKAEVEKIDYLADAAESAIERINEYRQALITSAVTGKIDVRRLA